ncbi:hypothetical protein [Variovorax ginsengisoli]|uniref:Type IV pilus biogenesis protein PilP n=1 Tax=Variovorax ginsengisoli TaxID=363844 RepID=A0ABT9SDG6_9BURK|nr:hypothetical protein [Variovorax ginsengisoli]MDP9902406.1 hypothetical protein [Variovorax ginsengisoli]
MFKTSNTIRVLLLVVCAVSGSSLMAQTIGQIAALQRAKQLAELEKGEKEAVEATKSADALMAPIVSLPPTKPKPTAAPGIFLHAIYSKEGMWIAEVSQGQMLSIVFPGMLINGYRASAINQQGVEVSKLCATRNGSPQADRECGKRVIHLGEAF